MKTSATLSNTRRLKVVLQQNARAIGKRSNHKKSTVQDVLFQQIRNLKHLFA